MDRCALLALGSNAKSKNGSPKEVITLAIRAVSVRIGHISESSLIYRTPCFPAGAGPDFANAVIRVETALTAPEILTELHDIEAEFGRTREVRWGQRTLDIDLLALDQEIHPNEERLHHWIELPLEQQMVETPQELLIPHPRIQDRAFVLVPMADVAPDWNHPVLKKSVAEMLTELSQTDVAEVVPYD